MADPLTVVSLWASITGLFTPTSLFLFVNLVIGTIVITSRFTSHGKLPPPHDHDLPRLVPAPSLLDRVKSIDFSLYKFPQYRNPEEEAPYFPPSAEPVHGSNPVDSYPPQLQRAPSLIERVRSFDFSSIYKSQQPYPETETEVIDNSASELTEPVHDSNPVDPYPPQLERAPSLIERVRSFNFSSIYKSQQPYPETETTEVIHNSVSEPVNPGPDPDHPPRRSKSESKKTAVKVRDSVKKSASEKSMTVGEAEEKPETVERRRPETTRPERTTSFGDGDEGVDAKADDFINKFKKQLKLQRLDSLLRYKEMLSGK